jgi:hypothetical protein
MMEQAAEQDFDVDRESDLDAAHPFVAAKTPIAAPADKNSRRDLIRLSPTEILTQQGSCATRECLLPAFIRAADTHSQCPLPLRSQKFPWPLS